MAEIPLKVAVRDEGKVADVTVGAGTVTLTAQGVSHLIRALAIARFSMSPPVETKAPTKIDVHSDTLFEVKGAGPRGGVFIGFRHAAFGWIHFHLPQTSVDRLSKGLARSSVAHQPPKRLQ